MYQINGELVFGMARKEGVPVDVGIFKETPKLVSCRATLFGTIDNALCVIEEASETGELELNEKALSLANRNVARCDRFISELLAFSRAYGENFRTTVEPHIDHVAYVCGEFSR